jgi:rhodanese-related sulfurtransferase
MKKVIFIFLCSTYLFSQYLAPKNVDGAITIDSKEAYNMFMKNDKFLDVRPIRFLSSGKIKNSLHLFVDEFTQEKIEKIVNKKENLIIYCNGQSCPLSSKAIIKLKSYGYTQLYYYRDGIPAWKYYKLPIQ